MDKMMTGANAATIEQAPLDGIAARILNAAEQATEIGTKLNDHANRVHGHIPTKPAEGSDKPEPDIAGALDRIYRALANLDRAQAYMAEAAGRNTTLA